jgi:hypothetical protein
MDNVSYGGLGIRHFDQFSSPKNIYKNWEDLVADGTVVKCKECIKHGKEKWIWSMWHVDCYDTVSKKAKYDHMDLCGPCFFKDND